MARNTLMHPEPPRANSRLGRGIRTAPLLLLIAAFAATSGCSTIPHEELTRYRHAMAEAQQASRPVINDLGTAWRHAEELLNGEGNGEHDSAGDWREFDPAGPRQSLTIEEQVMTRHTLWLAVVAYSDALAAVAEGRSTAAVRAEVNGFLDAVRTLPVRRLTDLAAGAQPLSAVISESLALVEREIAARRFHEAVEAGGPLVDATLDAMQQEINDHYDLRLAITTHRRREIEARIQLDLIPAFRGIDQATGTHPEKTKVRNELNDILRASFGYSKRQLLDAEDSADAPPPSPSELAQLVSLLGDVKSAGDQYAALRDQLVAYQGVLRAYHDLLTSTRRALMTLRERAEDAPAASASDALLAAINLYWHFSQYESMRARQ